MSALSNATTVVHSGLHKQSMCFTCLSFQQTHACAYTHTTWGFYFSRSQIKLIHKILLLVSLRLDLQPLKSIIMDGNSVVYYNSKNPMVKQNSATRAIYKCCYVCYNLTRFNMIATQRFNSRWQVDQEAFGLSRVQPLLALCIDAAHLVEQLPEQNHSGTI